MHPAEEVPLTVYTVVTDGDNVIVLELLPLSQVYVAAPLEDKTAEVPAQIVAELIVKVGNEFTIRVKLAELLQLLVLVPVML